jgi:hypothetical protein
VKGLRMQLMQGMMRGMHGTIQRSSSFPQPEETMEPMRAVGGPILVISTCHLRRQLLMMKTFALFVVCPVIAVIQAL